MFELNIFNMQIDSEKDFPEVRKQFDIWRRRFPMFRHDVNHIESIIEQHIQNYSIALVHYRQTKGKSYLLKAQFEIDNINRILSTVNNLELMVILKG